MIEHIAGWQCQCSFCGHTWFETGMVKSKTGCPKCDDGASTSWKFSDIESMVEKAVKRAMIERTLRSL
jgi:predicted  nucleic acid-binding Zn-ribbon protein